MTKLEKVIKGLECCIQPAPECRHCPYDDKYLPECNVVVERDALELLKAQQPTVDAVPVVRCKDCIHYDNESECCLWFGMMISKKWYCAKGERREGYES